ncbi:MAG TPA: PilZ domain-containing protein [Thermoanaerobaculia bacterium]
MRPLTTTLTPAEVATLLDFPPSLVDALLDSGRVLCHVKGGEVRVPLAQLEELFREALIRVYQGEAPAAEPSVILSREDGEGPPPDEAASVPAVESFSVFAAPEDRPVPKAAPPEPPDQRRMPRYIPRRQIDGLFGDTKFSIVQISASGLRIRHREPLVPGSEAKLTFALLKPARSVVVRMRVVWTSLASSGEDRFAISGLRAIEHADRLARAVDSLLATHELQPERRARQRRSDDAMSVLATASDDEIALVTSAMRRFASDPVEANRWYSRARFALSDENVRRVAPPKPRDREEVLGIWEYLERQVEIEKIASVVAWSRAS